MARNRIVVVMGNSASALGKPPRPPAAPIAVVTARFSHPGCVHTTLRERVGAPARPALLRRRPCLSGGLKDPSSDIDQLIRAGFQGARVTFPAILAHAPGVRSWPSTLSGLVGG